MSKCSECGYETDILWNGGRCWDCHDARCSYSLDGDLPNGDFDPAYAGERWSDDY